MLRRNIGIRISSRSVNLTFTRNVWPNFVAHTRRRVPLAPTQLGRGNCRYFSITPASAAPLFPRISTLDKSKLTETDFLDLQGSPSQTVLAGIYPTPVPITYGSYEGTSYPFPHGTQGFLYYSHDSSSLSPIAGEIRFRCTHNASPSSFAAGVDLPNLFGVPWRIPLLVAVCRPKYAPFFEALHRGGCIRDFESAMAQCTEIVRTSPTRLDEDMTFIFEPLEQQEFSIDLQDKTIVLWVVGRNGAQKLEFESPFYDYVHKAFPWSGHVVVKFTPGPTDRQLHLQIIRTLRVQRARLRDSMSYVGKLPKPFPGKLVYVYDTHNTTTSDSSHLTLTSCTVDVSPTAPQGDLWHCSSGDWSLLNDILGQSAAASSLLVDVPPEDPLVVPRQTTEEQQTFAKLITTQITPLPPRDTHSRSKDRFRERRRQAETVALLLRLGGGSFAPSSPGKVLGFDPLKLRLPVPSNGVPPRKAAGRGAGSVDKKGRGRYVDEVIVNTSSTSMSGTPPVHDDGDGIDSHAQNVREVERPATTMEEGEKSEADREAEMDVYLRGIARDRRVGWGKE